MSYARLVPEEFEWITRPHEADEPARHVAELSDRIGLVRGRANVWRYEPGAAGRRHRHRTQEETFVVLSGTLSMYIGEPHLAAIEEICEALVIHPQQMQHRGMNIVIRNGLLGGFVAELVGRADDLPAAYSCAGHP